MCNQGDAVASAWILNFQPMRRCHVTKRRETNARQNCKRAHGETVLGARGSKAVACPGFWLRRGAQVHSLIGHSTHQTCRHPATPYPRETLKRWIHDGAHFLLPNSSWGHRSRCHHPDVSLFVAWQFLTFHMHGFQVCQTSTMIHVTTCMSQWCSLDKSLIVCQNVGHMEPSRMATGRLICRAMTMAMQSYILTSAENQGVSNGHKFPSVQCYSVSQSLI